MTPWDKYMAEVAVEEGLVGAEAMERAIRSVGRRRRKDRAAGLSDVLIEKGLLAADVLNDLRVRTRRRFFEVIYQRSVARDGGPAPVEAFEEPTAPVEPEAPAEGARPGRSTRSVRRRGRRRRTRRRIASLRS